MKWVVFRELPPEKRKALRGPKLLRIKSSRKFVMNFPDDYRESKLNDFLVTAAMAVALLNRIKTPEDLIRFFTSPIGQLPFKRRKMCAPHIICAAIICYPKLFLGYFDKRNEFNPGILCRPLVPEYSDALELILCEENLSGKRISEVVAMCYERKRMKTTNDAVRQRIRTWKGNWRETWKGAKRGTREQEYVRNLRELLTLF
jgi:hypothetical protein